MTRIALYLRVSKKDSSQDVENQRGQLLGYAARRGWEIVAEYTDNESGRAARGERAGFDEMFRAAARGEFELLLFWSLDRFSREGTGQTLNYLKQLDGAGVKFHSFQEEYINTDNDMIRPLLIAIVSHFAAYEARRISDRTKAGLERAVRQGKHLGRPQKIPGKGREIEAAIAAGITSPAAIAKRIGGISESSVRRYLKGRLATNENG